LDDNAIEDSGAKTIGTIKRIGGSSISVNYNFNGKNYTAVVGQTNYTLQNGEVYTILIDRNNPENCLVQFSQPIFDKADYYLIRDATFEKLLLSDYIKFKYVYAGRKYTRIQNIVTELNVVQINKKAMVFVNKKRPEIAYLILN
jgi:hypothetical protein